MNDIANVQLGTVASFIRGITFKPDDVISRNDPEAVECMRTKNVQAELDTKDVLGIPARFVNRQEQFLREGDILVSSANSWNLLGKCSWVPMLHRATTLGGFISALRADRDKVDARYLYHWFNSSTVQEDVRNCGRQTTNISNLDLERCRRMGLPLPSLAEQRRIAAILDQAEALRTKRRQALAKLDTLTQSLYLEMFGDPVANSLNWPSLRVDQLCTLVRGSSPRPQGDSRYYDGSVPRLMVADVTRDGWLVTPAIDSLTEAGAALSRPVPKGTVVMAVSGNVGVVSQLAVPACIHDGFVGFTKLKNDLIQPYFLTIVLHLLKQTHGQRKAGAIFQNLTTTDIKAMCLPVPPMPQQLLFVERCAVVSRNVALSRKSDSKVDDLIVSLQRRAFRGEL